MVEHSSKSTAAPEVIARLVSQRHAFLSFLERRLGSRAVAEDLLQEAFARGLGKVEQLEHEESAQAWFYRLLRNAITDYRRRSGSVERKLEEFSRELEHAAQPEVEAAVCGCVNGLTAALKPEYAEALRSVEVEGASLKDFAARVGITPNLAAVRVFRARKALKREVERCCGSCADSHCHDCSCHAP